MAQYRLEAQIIGRGTGRSAIAAAAYRSGETLVDRRRGLTHDYTSRHGVRFSEVVVPPGSPPISRADLWNAIENAETRADGQLARELLLACPHELSDAQNVALVRGFVAEQLTAHGVVVDWAMHGPDRRGDARNVHAHVLSTMRPYAPDGTFGAKSDLRHLNAREQLLQWRVSWEQHVNRALEKAHVRERVSAAARARDPVRARYATEPKQGPLATDMERGGHRTFAGDDRRAARRQREREERRARERGRNRSRRDAAAVVNELTAQLRHALRGVSLLVAETARELIVEHPAQDRFWEFRRAAAAPDARRRYNTPGLRGWSVSQKDRTTVFRKGNKSIESDGARVRLSAGVDAKMAAAALDVVEASGWTTMRIRGGASPADKAALILAALERGIEPVVDDADKALVQRLRGVHERGARVRDVGDRARDREAARDRSREARGGPAPGSPAAAPNAQRDTEAILDETFRALAQQRSTFTHQELERALSRFAPDPQDLAALLVAAREHPELVELGVDDRGRTRFVPQAMHAKEIRFIEDALAKAQRRIPGLDSSLRDKIAKDLKLTEHQREPFKVLTAGRGLVLLRGIAGGGKSYLMGAVREFYEQNGKSLHGAALAGVAADGLALESKIDDSRTIAQWRAYFEHQPAITGSVLVLDEAGMAGTDDLDALLRKFDQVIIVGDDRQLQPISAGAAFRALAERLPDDCKAELSQPGRQKVEWMKKATKLFYDGRTREALQLYDKNGRWLESSTLDDAKAALVEAWAAERQEHPDKSQLVLAYTRADVLDLNQRLREVRRANGELEGADVTLELANGERAFAVNENVYFHEPWKAEEKGVALTDAGGKPLKIRNGTIAVVTAIDPTANTVTVRLPDKANRAVTIDLAKYKSLDYADARTLHTAQGKTVDLVRFLATPQRGVQADLAYVGDSRHRFDMHLHWSRDVFKNKNHVYRTLERFEPKDYSLDYSRDDQHAGFGIPNQARNGVAIRAPYQVRIELQNMLATAANLRATSPMERRADADRAYGEVNAWYQRMEGKLRQLEAVGVRGIAISGSAEDLASRLALLERSVSVAVERLEERERGRADDRFSELRAEVARLRADVSARREAAIGIQKPTLLAPPNIAIANELRRLERLVQHAGPTPAEEAQIRNLEQKSLHRGSDTASVRARLEELRGTIHMRETHAKAALSAARVHLEDPKTVAAMKEAYEQRIGQHEAYEQQVRVAEVVIAACDRQDNELAQLESRLATIANTPDLSHEQIDAMLVEINGIAAPEAGAAIER